MISNKEDTHVINEELGLMQSKIDFYIVYLNNMEKQIHRNSVFTNIQLPLTFISGAVTVIGAIEWYNGKDIGKYMCIGGGAAFATIELTYNMGHLVFKRW